MNRVPFCLCFGFVTVAFSGNAFAQGSLTPPGAPAPTMKTLSQVEPRIPITSVPVTITNAGSYFLTTNLTGTYGQPGISVETDNVTIDLSGFRLHGGGGNISPGVVAPGVRTNIAVRNGSITGWLIGISLDTSHNCRLEDLRISHSLNAGIIVGPGSTVQGCNAEANGGNGIGSVGAFGILVKDCSAYTNQGVGIAVGDGSQVTGCSSRGNTMDGIYVGQYGQVLQSVAATNGAAGITIGQHGRVSQCIASRNTSAGILTGANVQVTDSKVSLNSSGGIIASSVCVVKDCTVYQNAGDGIAVGDNSQIIGNNCSLNGVGIHTSGSWVRVENNNVVQNTSRGIKVDTGSGVLVIRNSVNGSGTNSYNIPAGNLVGPILATPASILTNSNPHANFAY